MRLDIIHAKEKIKRYSIIQKRFDFDYISKENIKKYNPKWPEIPDHPYRTLIIGGSGSTKTNALLNLIDNEPDIDKIYYMLKIHMKQNINY